jgi:hypothetical protein
MGAPMRAQPSADESTETSEEDEQSGRDTLEEPLRMLVRHQWVRDHNTPRLTVLSGPTRSGRALWEEWLSLTGRGRPERSSFQQPSRAEASWLSRTAPRAVQRVVASPREPVALIAEATVLSAWLAGRADRLAALLKEGVVMVDRSSGATARKAAGGPRPFKGGRNPKARSLAEFAMFDALESTPSTKGRFELNGLLSVDFGGRPAEVDLLSRTDEIAIEIDGYHHFTDETGYRRDRRKDVVLQAFGYAVLRFLATDVLADPSAAVRSVVELIGQRRRQRRIKR